ncbi:NADP-dependent oxidoreductase [Amycolatopsis sp. NPDC059021]|uniref:NADP-dependent oxidoreductase n=1 Tax=Amycolatopsis sp. NPDC059021 TaxID=3346704 RepID=UPI00366D594C
MKAIAVTRYGGPEVLRVLDLPEPHAGPGEVRVRVRAAAVNPADIVLREGGLAERFEFAPPYVPGMDVAGVLDEIGEGVTTPIALGERVIAVVVPIGERRGSYAEYVVVPAESVVRAPSEVDDVAASTLLMNALTARQAVDVLKPAPGRTVAVTGAAGAVGGYVIPLAKEAGLRVIAVAAPADEPLVREFGADEVVARGDDLAARIREVVPGGVDGVVDAALIGPSILPAIRDGGVLAVVRPFEGEPERGITVHRVRVSDDVRSTAALERLRDLAEQGVLRLRVARTYRPEEAAEAHRAFERGGLRGRLVFEF